jgi:autotransporter-associated beta strand protein
MLRRLTAIYGTHWNRLAVFVAASVIWLSIASGKSAAQQRVLGVDVSYWNRGSSSATANGITQSDWNTAYSTPNANGYTRQFAFVRATRGGTTGLSTGSGTPNNPPATETLSRRYDDPEFLRTMTRATTAGLFAGPYHYGRPSVAGNTGADEADHYIEYASAYMRPGYLMPILDYEEGAGAEYVQFTIDFSNRLYERMKIRPGIYVGGSRSANMEGATASQKDQLAKPATFTPSVVGPAFPMLWNPYYANNTNPESINVQGTNPKSYYSGFYGPWDNYGNSQPWSFWQYASTVSVPGINNRDATVDGNVSQGDIEYVKNYLVPAVWWNDTSGDWSTMTNWNSGQPLSTFNASDLNNPPAPYVPHVGTGQTTPFTSYTLPVPRLPGTAGSGPAVTSGVNDTVILERPNANITVTLSSGAYNIRKLYMRETLAITGGSLTINYDPTYRPDTSSTVLHGGPISAQFSGPVTLSNGSLTVHTAQIDSAQTFTLAGGTLTFNTINMISNSATKIAVNGDVTINPLNNATATIKRSSTTGTMDFGGGTRAITVGNGSADVDLDIVVPIANGGLTKNGAGTMRLSGSNIFTGPVTVNGGVLRTNNGTGFSNNSAITVNNGGTLDLNGFSDAVASLAGASGGVVLQGSAGLTVSAGSGATTFDGTITGSGTFTKGGASTQILGGNNTLGPVSVSGGKLLFNGTNTTGAVTVGNTATLGGTGSVSGAVTVNSGGHIAPGESIESLGVGPLTLNIGSVLDIELAAPGASDLINVGGLLTLNGGSVNLTDLGGMDAGLYTLINYGTRSGSVDNLGAPTGGPTDFQYKLVDTGSSISLLVSIPGDFNLDGVVDGADFLIWRKDNGPQTDYDMWRANYGRAAGSGSGAGLGGSASVPEPEALVLLLSSLLLWPYVRGRSSRN